MDIDKLTEKLIIEVGRATPSGSRLGVAVIDLSFISGDNFAFTNRFVALSERIRFTDAQLRRFVITLPKTRRFASFALLFSRAASAISACFCSPGRQLFTGFTRDQHRAFVFGGSR